MNKGVHVDNLTLKKGKFVLGPISFCVEPKQVFAIIGRTGAGKTLLLESIAGCYNFDYGKVDFDGGTAQIGFVYQDYGLFPHLSVYDNIAYGLKMRKVSKGLIRQKVLEIAKKFSIENKLDDFPSTLSGGEKQRTAFARALIIEPNILLLDEPFAALDPVTKGQMYTFIKQIRENFNCTIVFVTHDFKEAELLADKIGIMINGQMQEIFEPKNLFLPHKDCVINNFLGIKEWINNEQRSQAIV